MTICWGEKESQIEIEILRETEKAFLIETEDVILREYKDECIVTAWIPKSVWQGNKIAPWFTPNWQFKRFIK